MKKCGTCGKLRATRPYGKGSAPICFKCAFATPESKEETDRQLEARFVLAEVESLLGVAVIGGEDGPAPLTMPSPRKPS